MSDVQNTTLTAEKPAEDSAITSPQSVETAATSAPAEDGPIGESIQSEISPVEPATEAMPAGETTTAAATEPKATEPVSEGQLGYKAPGLVKSLIFSKHEFWLSDEPVSAQHMDHYMRGEHPEVSHPIVGWASQTGKGLLFFNKKGITDKTHPQGVLPLYEASDLEKKSPHEFSLKLGGKRHTFKAANDAERDGWYQEIEKSMEMGKASMETTRGSEGYKDSMKKLGTPNILAAGGAAAAGTKTREASRPKKSTELDTAGGARRVGSSSDDDDDAAAAKKANKSRSRSRGFVDRLKGKKEEHDVKKDVKKEEKEDTKEEKEEAKQEKKIEKEEKKAEKHGETPVVGGATLDAPSTASRVIDAPVEDGQAAPVSETTPAAAADGVADTNKASKPSKRTSVFGRMSSGWGSMKSPSKEKSQSEAGLDAPVVPPKDTGVSDTPPVLPETTTDKPIETPAVPSTEEPEAATETAPAATNEPSSATTPSKEKSGFLNNLPFINKRNRSVSPSPATEAPAVPPKNDEPATEASKVEEPLANSTPAAPAAEEAAKPTEEPATETTSPASKRTSVLGNFSSLGRRASSAFTGRSKQRKESATPALVTESKDEPESAATEPAATGESTVPETEKAQDTIGDVVPEAITTGHAQTPVSAAA